MNRMPFFDHLRGTVGLWIATYVFYGFAYHIRTGHWVYPVSLLQEPRYASIHWIVTMQKYWLKNHEA